MCQMSVLVRGSDDELVMESVTRLDVKDGGIEVATFFEEPKFVADVTVQSIDFLGGKVYLEKKKKECQGK